MLHGANGFTIVNAAGTGMAVSLGQAGTMSGSSKLEVGGTVRLDGVAAATAVAADLVYFRDADDSLMKGESFADVRDNLVYASVSGDATVAAGGALTIAADAVHATMLNDDVISAQTELAHADILDADELMISDGGVIKRVGVDSLQNHYFAAISGDATVADGGALTIAAGAVEHGMLAEDIISGQAALGGASVAQADLLMLDDGPGTVKKVTFSNFEDSIFGNVSGDATIAAGGALTIAAGAVESGMLNANVISGQTDIGAGLAITDEILVSDAGVLRRTDLSRFATMLAGSGLSVNNGQLQTQGSATAVAVDGGTLSEGYNFATGSLSLSVTLPSGSAGDVIHVKAAALGDGETLTINRNGSQTIDGQTSVVLESQYAAVSLVYVTDNDWRIV